MKTDTTYFCENCGDKFDNYLTCELHEAKCNNMHIKFKENVRHAVNLATSSFSDVIESISFKTDEEIDCYMPSMEYELYKFEIECTLKNGNIFSVYDGMDEDLWLGNYLESDVIYKSLSREINNRLPTSYEGVIRWEYVDGWMTDFLGDLELHEVVNRLNGRKVKIEVID